MRVRIIKKTFKGVSAYAIQGKVPFLPIWFILSEDDGLFNRQHVYATRGEALHEFNRIVEERDYRPESCVSEIIDEA